MQSFRRHAERFFRTSADSRPETHCLLDGGTLVVDDAHPFREMYLAFIRSGGAAYVVERCTHPVFPFFLDLDIHTDLFDNSWPAQIGKYVVGVVQQLFERAGDLYVLVSSAPNKCVHKGGRDVVKHGLHLHVPDLLVSTEMALLLREAVVQKLSNNLERRACPTTWADDVDAACIGKSLRMLYACKYVKCPTCKGRKKMGCATCLGVGSVDEGRAYTPLLRVGGDFVPSSAADMSPVEALRLTSVRCAATEPSHARRPMLPSWLEVCDAVDPSVPPRKRTRRLGVSGLREGHTELESALQGREPLGAGAVEEVRSWITRQARLGLLPKAYAGVPVSGFTCVHQRQRSIAFVKLDSCFCANIDREHNSNTVYLEIDGRAQVCYQKCFCRCDTVEGRRNRNSLGQPVRCRDYRSAPISSAKLQAVLFGGPIATSLFE